MKILDATDMNFTHAMLGEFMPWYSGWLDDGEGKPVQYSVMLSSMLNAVEVIAGIPEREVYKN
jgi:hypothetical protein